MNWTSPLIQCLKAIARLTLRKDCCLQKLKGRFKKSLFLYERHSRDKCAKEHGDAYADESQVPTASGSGLLRKFRLMCIIQSVSKEGRAPNPGPLSFLPCRTRSCCGIFIHPWTIGFTRWHASTYYVRPWNPGRDYSPAPRWPAVFPLTPTTTPIGVHRCLQRCVSRHAVPIWYRISVCTMKPVFEVDIKMHKKMCIFAGSLYTPTLPHAICVREGFSSEITNLFALTKSFDTA
jgi:hypothetical protein